MHQLAVAGPSPANREAEKNMNRYETRVSFLLSLAVVISTSAVAVAQERAEALPPVAVVDGMSVTDADLSIRKEMIQLEHSAYQLRLRALEDWILRRLLGKEAAARNLTVEELMKQEVDSKFSESPTEPQGSPADPSPRDAKIREARQEFLRKLRAKSSVQILLEPSRLAVNIEDAPRRGPSAAPITVVEFSDFQCPFCKRAQSVLREILARYGDLVSLVFKDLPLARIHPEAQRSAEAAHCAREQGKFWEFHDALFAQESLSPETPGLIARSLSLDGERLQSCLESHRFQFPVEASLRQASELGLTSTPSFLINGILVIGAQPLEVFTRVIDAELAAAKNRPTNPASKP